MFSLSEINPTLVTRRRVLFGACNLFLVAVGVAPMVRILSEGGWSVLEMFLLALFIVLLTQVAYGFTLATTGFCLLWRGGDRVRINNTLPSDAKPRSSPATAIVMPIFNEEISRVFQGVRVMYESLQNTAQSEAFDFFILSDSSDPNYWIAEEKAWLELCKQMQGFGRIFYRKRRVALHHKSGNIADFCRRWGAKYRYMIVLDADSVMTGKTFVRLVSLMEQNPGVGIIQTNPELVLGKSLFQRIMQFMSRLYRPVFSVGANFWQLGSGNFWGHNAIIRIRPFMQHCAIPELPETRAFGTRILSHDTIEAALMRRAGYTVWLAYDAEGSYEEGPPDLLASLQRDRRWCYGNLQHLWFLFARGLKIVSRFHIFNGILAYVSSPLWLMFLLLSTVLALNENPEKASGTAARSGLLFAYVMALLLLPKLWGTMLLLRSRDNLQAYGGRGKVLLSALAEIIFSIVFAPILMFAYTRFVWCALTGLKARWRGQKRGADNQPSWRDLASAHLGATCWALAWGGVAAWLAPWFLPALSLILFGLIVSIPFSCITASKMLGAWTRQAKWFLVPEETEPPVELKKVEEPFTVPAGPFFQSREYAADYGLLQVILDPYVNAVHVALLRQRPQVSIRTRQFLNALSERLLRDGPFSLTSREKRALLWDCDSTMLVHQKLWSSSVSNLHDWWQAALRHYNESVALSIRRTVNAR